MVFIEVKMKQLPKVEIIKSLLDYDQEKGILVWKKRLASDFKTKSLHAIFMSRFSNKRAGSISAEGYRKITISGHIYSEHKLIWKLIYNEDVKYPEFEIDHINGVRSDNRIANLRKVTKSDNQRNGSMRKNNKSGVNGVNWCNPKEKWIARIWVGKRHLYLGQFDDLQEAKIKREAAEIEFGYHQGHGKNPQFVNNSLQRGVNHGATV
jgi:hypothetical protein